MKRKFDLESEEDEGGGGGVGGLELELGSIVNV
jgi:hypothetical protein